MPLPLYEEIPYQEPIDIFALFHHDFGSALLDSSLFHQQLGRYSYIAIDPFDFIQSKNGRITTRHSNSYGDPFTVLNALISKYTVPSFPGLPPYQGGFVGYFGYELYQHLENIPFAQTDDMQFSDMNLGIYDLIIAFDTFLRKAFIISSGFPEMNLADRQERARARLTSLLIQLKQRKINKGKLCPLNKKYFKSYFSQETYCLAVQKVIDYILAGDIFETNISQRFISKLPNNYSSFELYKYLREINPASFSAYLNFSPTKLISASPERFIKLHQGTVETRPIKGTRARGKTAAEDQKNANELLASPKDNAENVMIVDLMRNDLSRVCDPHSVIVTQLCGLESFATVHHLVSVVNGKLKSQYNAIHLLRASFPGGSITGAPKIRAMEIIAEVEPTQRGPYCGSIGYISWSGDMDTSITIRTIAIRENTVSYQVGGAIVADSNPQEEYEETLTKGKALLRALTDE
jgi:para-aminobenzoate synthetase component 1